MMIPITKTKCPHCGSKNFYARRGGAQTCRKCGNDFGAVVVPIVKGVNVTLKSPIEKEMMKTNVVIPQEKNGEKSKQTNIEF
jgi:ribosomal protein L37AE/L43A